MSWEPTELLEALDDSVSVLTRDARWVYANPAAERIFGIPRADLIGKSIWDVFPGAIDSDFHRAFLRVEATGAAEVADHYYVPWDRWYRNQIVVIGSYIHVVARDITEHKQGEARLLALARASQAFARALEVDQLFDAIARSLAECVGDACVVRVVEEGALRTVALYHPDAHRQKVLREFFGSPLALDEGLSAAVLKTGEPLLIERIDTSELRDSFHGDVHRTSIERSRGAHSTIAIALSAANQRVGVITMLRDRTPRSYTRNDLSLLQDLGERASMALTGARLLEQARQGRQRATTVANASRAFAAAERDTSAILDLLARAVAAELGEIAVASVISEDRQYFEPIAYASNAALAHEVQAMLTARTPVAGSLSERVVATGTPLRVSNFDIEAFASSTPAKYADMVRRFAPKSFIMLPIKRGERVLGTLTASRQASSLPYTDTDQQLLEELADRAGLSIENAHTLEAERLARQAAERVAEQTRRLQAIGSHLSHRRSAREVAETVLRESTVVLGPSTGAIWLLDDTGTRLDMLAQVGYPDPARFASFPIETESPLCVAVRTESALFVGNVKEYAERFPVSAKRVGDAAPPEFATACLPLVSEGRAIGGLAFAFPHAQAFRADERTFLGVLANQCAQAIDRSRLLEQERAASSALAETNRTLNAVIHASPAAIVIADLHGVIRLWNPAAERMFGWTADEAVGRLWPGIDEGFRDEYTQSLAHLARGELITGLEKRRRRRDGTMIEVALWAAPVHRPDGEIQALEVFVDITDRKRAEEAARAADRRKDEFLAMLGHELRNPLAPILTALELLRFRNEPGGVRERELIERQTRHLVRLVDDLLDLSRITRGKVELRRARTDLSTVIAQAVEMSSPLLEQRGHHVSIAAPRGVLFVDGDPFRLAQVFQNLMTNAAKYTPSGGSITVRAHVQADEVVVEIEDNGEGIASDALTAIFEPFVQGARKLDRAQGGLGIGLTLVRSLTELHGGRVEAHSAGPGEGSRFVVWLPRSSDATPVATSAPDRLPGLQTPRRVLLVDDNRDAAEMLAELLREAGHEVMVAHDGPSALGTAPAFRPDVALLDIGLPLMDGYDLARKLRAALPAAPRLVAISGYGQEHDRRRSQEAGFDAHLVKPVQAAQILAAVDDTPRSVS